MDDLGRFEECIIYVVRRLRTFQPRCHRARAVATKRNGTRHLGGGLQEQQTVLSGESFPLFSGDGALMLEISLIATKHDDHVGRGMLSSIFQPQQQVIECVCRPRQILSASHTAQTQLARRTPASDVIDKESASCTAVVAPCDASERLCAVPVRGKT